MQHHAAVNEYLSPGSPWVEPLSALRELLLSAGLEESFKWRAPCYCLDGTNVAMLGRLKDHCTLSFFRGVLLDNPDGLLRQPGDHSRSVRVLSFTRLDQIREMESTITAIIANAVAVARSGQRPDTSRQPELAAPAELTARFREQPELRVAFESLTPGRQRAYLIYFTGAEQSKSRSARVTRYADRILGGRGIHDCTCGLSRRMPRCDGSHRELKDEK